MSIETKGQQEPITRVETPAAQHIFSRQLRSRLDKFTFWAFLIGGLAGFGGTLALIITGGTPSQDLISTMVCGLGGAAILATRMRWAPLVSTLLALCLLYVVFTEPYAIESLIHPKTDPQGGFGHFVGVVSIIAYELLLFVCSIAAVAQNYQRGSRRTPSWLSSFQGVIVGLVIGTLLLGAIMQEATASGTTYTNGVPTIHMTAGSFLQSSVTLSKGSKLLLVDDVSAEHILSNGSWQNGVPTPANEQGAPKVNNVHVLGNSTQIGPFTTAGTYHIYCEIHKGMNLTITVQ